MLLLLSGAAEVRHAALEDAAHRGREGEQQETQQIQKYSAMLALSGIFLFISLCHDIIRICRRCFMSLLIVTFILL